MICSRVVIAIQRAPLSNNRVAPPFVSALHGPFIFLPQLHHFILHTGECVGEPFNIHQLLLSLFLHLLQHGINLADIVLDAVLDGNVVCVLQLMFLQFSEQNEEKKPLQVEATFLGMFSWGPGVR